MVAIRSSRMMLVASVCAAAIQACAAASLLPPAAPAPLLDAHDRALLASSNNDDTLLWSQLPAFYDSSDAAVTPIRGCTGALVAPRFVLTTAACATQHRIAKVSFTQGSDNSTDATLSRAVVASVAHPRFELAGPSRYNVALLELAAPLPFVTLALDFAPALAGEQFVRVSSWDKQVTSVSVSSLAACAGDNGLVTLPSDAADGSLVCLGSALSSQSESGSSILVYKGASTALLSGFELPREAGASRVFISMRGVANFINAIADGLQWGLHTDLPPPEPEMPTPTPAPSESTLTPALALPPTPTPPAVSTPAPTLPTSEPTPTPTASSPTTAPTPTPTNSSIPTPAPTNSSIPTPAPNTTAPTPIPTNSSIPTPSPTPILPTPAPTNTSNATVPTPSPTPLLPTPVPTTPTPTPLLPTPVPMTPTPTPLLPTPVPTTPTPTTSPSYVPTDEPPEPLPPSPTPTPTIVPPVTPIPTVVSGPPTPAPTPVTSPALAYPRAWYPYVATLHLKRGGKSFCGGTLVGPYHVLTAAHCVADGIVNWVALGSGTGALQEIPVSRVTPHPRYQPESMLYDAAVLELANFADSTRWVKLDAARDYPDQTVARVVSGITMSTTFVNALSLPIWARAKCEAQYPVVSTPVLCAGGNSGVDACAGNSGSPLILSSSSNSDVDVLVGIVSAGFGCGTRGVPGFYTRIASVADFVAQFTIPAIPDPSTPPYVLPTAAPPIYSAPGVLSLPSSASSIPSGGGGRTTQTPVAAFGSTATPYPSSIHSATLDPEVTPLAKAKALVFLAGEYENSLVSRTFWTKIVDPTNAVVLYSTGDLQGVLSVVKQRSALPLNQRLDRFNSVGDRQRTSTSASQC